MSPWIVWLLLVLTVGVASELDEQKLEEKVSYKNYVVIEIALDFRNLPELKREIVRHIILDNADGYESRNVTLLVKESETEKLVTLFRKYKVPFEDKNINFQQIIENEAKNIREYAPIKDRMYMDFKHFNDYFVYYHWLHQIADDYHAVAELIDLPLNSSNELLTQVIRGVKISDKKDKPTVVIEAGIHGNEWIGPAVATFILKQLLTSRSTDVEYLLQNFNWIIFPICNPDGYKYTFDKDRLWRKNRQTFGNCTGVDLNRNWDSANNLEHADPCGPGFPGTAAFSAPETATLAGYLRKNVKSQNIKTYLSFHGTSQKLLMPFATSQVKASMYDKLKEIGRKAVEGFLLRYKKKFELSTYHAMNSATRGTSLDWVYDELKLPIVFLYEFRRPVSRDGKPLYLLPVDQIEEVGWETLDSIKELLTAANILGFYKDKEVSGSDDSVFILGVLTAVVLSLVLSILLTAIGCFYWKNRRSPAGSAGTAETTGTAQAAANESDETGAPGSMMLHTFQQFEDSDVEPYGPPPAADFHL